MKIITIINIFITTIIIIIVIINQTPDCQFHHLLLLQVDQELSLTATRSVKQPALVSSGEQDKVFPTLDFRSSSSVFLPPLLEVYRPSLPVL